MKLKPEEIAGKTDFDFYPEELAEKYRADDKRIMESGKTQELEKKYIQEGKETVIQTIKTPVKDEQGNIIGVESDYGKGSNFWFIIPFARQKHETPSFEPRDNFGGVRMLIVDDNETNRIMLAKQLQSWKINVETAADGTEALAKMRSAANKKKTFTAAIIGQHMPEMDGLVAAAIIRDPKSRVRDHNIPILALTAHAMEGDREKCLAVGMNGYITKPVSIKSITDAIANSSYSGVTDQLHTGDHGLQCCHSHPVSKHGVNSSGNLIPLCHSHENGNPDISSDSGFPIPAFARMSGMTENVQPPAIVFDSKAFSDRMSGDNAPISAVINAFLSETQMQIRELEQAIKKRHRGTVSRLSHTIKGGAATFGANKLHALVFKIGTACKTADWQEAKALIPQLSKQFEMLERAMREYLKTLS